MQVNQKVDWEQFRTLLIIINGVCLIMTMLLLYKHYFQNNDKGIDDYLLALCIYSFVSFFGAMTSIVELKTRKLKWLIIGLLYVILNALYLEFEVLFGQNVLVLILVISSIPFFLISALILCNKNPKVYHTLLRILYVFSFLTSFLPVCFFALSIFSIIFTIFYKS